MELPISSLYPAGALTSVTHKEPEGIAYNVPGQAQITLTDGKKKLYEGEIPVTQFGIIEYLAPVLFNKNSTIKVYFDPVTGGLLKVDREEGK